ncbi:MAG: hypothetical protein IKB34_00045 [Clostridia bacterium]|nr:hypothetical protein [Clostridia bacterium]
MIGKRITAIALLIITVLLTGQLYAWAQNEGDEKTKIPTEELASRQSAYLKNNFRPIEKNRDSGVAPIMCFDVSADGRIACGYKSGNKGSVLVFDREMSFLYGFELVYGSEFYIRWDESGKDITLYYPESEIFLTVTPELELHGICKIASEEKTEGTELDSQTTDYAAIALERFKITEATAEGMSYRLSEPTADSSGREYYLRLTATDALGEETVLVQAPPLGSIGRALTAVMFAVIGAFAVYFAAVELIRYRGSRRKASSPKGASDGGDN